MDDIVVLINKKFKKKV